MAAADLDKTILEEEAVTALMARVEDRKKAAMLLQSTVGDLLGVVSCGLVECNKKVRGCACDLASGSAETGVTVTLDNPRKMLTLAIKKTTICHPFIKFM